MIELEDLREKQINFEGKIADLRPRSLLENRAQEFTDSYDFKQFIKIIYRVRCNLFHGNKTPLNDGDCQIVENAFKLLNMFLTRLYEEENYIEVNGDTTIN